MCLWLAVHALCLDQLYYCTVVEFFTLVLQILAPSSLSRGLESKLAVFVNRHTDVIYKVYNKMGCIPNSNSKFSEYLTSFTHLLITMNSSINTFIYFIKHKTGISYSSRVSRNTNVPTIDFHHICNRVKSNYIQVTK